MGCKQFKERVFRSGMEPALRRTAWKFLLGVFPPNSSFADRQHLLAEKRQQYLGLKQQWTSITDQQAARCGLLIACGVGRQQCALHTSIALQSLLAHRYMHSAASETRGQRYFSLQVPVAELQG